MKLIYTSVFYSIFALTSVWGGAVEIDKTSYPESRSVEGIEMSIQGTDLLRYKGIWKLYTGALYLDDKDELSFEKRARRLEVVYRRDIKGPDLVNAGTGNLESSFEESELDTIREELKTINSWWMQTLKKDDRAAITYIPGKGTNLTINEESKGWIPGEEFARIYFSIWFGDSAVSPEFRDALMKK